MPESTSASAAASGLSSPSVLIRTGEHTGTHFDAPNHWITGKDLADVASVPARQLVAPGPRTAPLLVDAKVVRERGSWWLEEAFRGH